MFRILRLRRLILLARVLILGTTVMFAASAFAKRKYFDILGNVLLPDFVAHYTGGVFAGKPDLYSIDAQGTFESTLLSKPNHLNLFISPPYVAWLYWPYAQLPLNLAEIAWAITIGLCFVAIYKILRTSAPEPKRAQRSLFLLFALSFQPLIEVVTSGQDTCLSGLLWAIGIHFALKKRDFESGLAFGLGLFKPQLFVLPFLYMLLKGRWKAILGMAVTASIWIAIGLASGGVHAFQSWIAILQSPEYLEFTRKNRIWKMHSLVAMLEGFVPAALDPVARMVGNVVSLVLGILSLRSATKKPNERHAWSLLVVASVLCSPHLFSYDLALLVIPALLLLREPWPRSTVYAIIGIDVLVWISPVRAESFRYDPWPMSILAMSLTPIAVLVVWRDLAFGRLPIRRRVSTDPDPIDGSSASTG